jgi:hypothetical protein
MPHSFSSDGAMKPMAAVSKPSSSTMKKLVANTSHWYGEKGWRSMNAWTSRSGWVMTVSRDRGFAPA